MNFIVKLADYSWQKILIIGVALAAAYYFLYFDDGARLDQALTTAEGELTREKELLGKTKTAMEDLMRFKEDLANQQAQVKEVLNFLPKQMNIGELRSVILERAAQAGLKVLKTDPKDAITRIEFYEATRIDVELEGTYNQIATFLSLLSKLPRLVTIDKIILEIQKKEPGESPKIKFASTLVGYRYVDDLKTAEGSQGNQNDTQQSAPGN